ncbi:MAG: transposase [Firmicutes bacterium]|nr:transposase [Alicyclobacillaceae bacterium]MCL6498375.1 transposase [Bacillota bacterium]
MTLTDDIVQHLFVGDGGVARLLEQVLNPVLQALAQAALHAAPYERTPERRGYRNGTYDRALPPESARGHCGCRGCEMGALARSGSPATNDTSKPSSWRYWKWSSTGCPPGKSPRSPRNAVAPSCRSRPSRPCASSSTPS